MIVYCNVDCENNTGNGECGLEELTISDDELRADGWYPRCKCFDEPVDNSLWSE